MRSVETVLALLAAFVLAVISSPSSQATTVSGRAYGLYVNAASYGIVDKTYCDTGWLPPEGGNLGESVDFFEIVGLASGDQVGAFSDSDD